jgi:hypothetical protein
VLMRWFLPLALLVGALATREARWYQRDHPRSCQFGSTALILLVGWFPLLIWIVNNLWPQN